MRSLLTYGSLIAVGLLVGVALQKHDEPILVAAVAPTSPAAASTESAPDSSTANGDVAALERQVAVLSAKLTAETDRRRRIEERVEALSNALSSLRAAPALPAATKLESAASTAADAAHGASSPVGGQSMSQESALMAAGVDSRIVNEIKRRQDEITMSDIYLRDLATREGWMDTPDFAAQLEEIHRRDKPIREEIGDDAYDRYLAALQQPNRVKVDEVLLDSPAALAGLQPGDLVMRYDDHRLFAPEELVAATRGGVAGETIRLEIDRQGVALEVEVARGPLGVRVSHGKSQGN